MNPTASNAANHGKVGSSSILITGQGGPSGSGRLFKGEPVLPAPVYTQEVAVAAANPMVLASMTATRDDKANKKSSSNSNNNSDSNKQSKSGSVPTSTWAATIAANNSSNAVSIGASNTSGGSSVSDTADLAPLHQSQPHAQPKATNINKAVGKVSSVAPVVPVPVPVSLHTSPLVQSQPTPTMQPAQSVTSERELDMLIEAIAPIQHFQYNAYNGFGRNVVFPVPTSTYHLSVWYKVMCTSAPDLLVNPYAMHTHVAVTDLLELTLPPVDAIGSISSWPKPLSAYSSTTVNINALQPDYNQNIQNIQQIVQEKSNLIDTSSNNNNNNNNKPSIQPLQQMFPGVKMQYGSSSTSTK